MTPSELNDYVTYPIERLQEGIEEGFGFDGSSVAMKGDVFSNDLIDAWIAYKRENEADHVRLRPVPAEFQLYCDC